VIGLLAPAAVAAALALALPRSRTTAPGGYIRWWPAAAGAFAVELALYNPPLDQQTWAPSLGPWIWVVTKIVLLAVVVHNARTSGRVFSPWWIAALGLGLNALVIAANDGYMPQSASAATAVWGAERVSAQRADARLQNVTPLVDSTRLPWLSDVIAEPAWLPRPNVVSIGDILLALGVAGWTFQALPRLKFKGAVGPLYPNAGGVTTANRES
jgi:hypothetical protein